MRRLTLLAAAGAALLAATSPVLAQTVAIVNGRILTQGPAGTLERGTVIIRDGHIAAVGADLAVPAGATVIDAAGKIVTPGFVAVDSALAASEVGSLPDTNDAGVDNNTLTAAFDVAWGLDPDSIVIPVTRLGGVTRAVVVPDHPGGGSGAHLDDGADLTAGVDASHLQDPGLFSGQAAIIHLGQSNDILVADHVAMLTAFGDAGARIAGGARGAEYTVFKTTLEEVRTYARNRAAYDRGQMRQLSLSKADLEALIPVVEGRMPLIVNVHRASDIRNVLRLAREEHLRIILDGAEEGWRVAAEIAAAGVPVLVDPLANLPSSFEVRGATEDNAARLVAAGVLIAIKGNEGSVHRAREQRYNAGNAVGHGLPYAEALKAITVNPARIFGMEGRFGSLQAGREADVVVWSGDPLEPLSQPLAIYIRGEAQPLTSRMLLLRDRYRTAGPMPPAYRN